MARARTSRTPSAESAIPMWRPIAAGARSGGGKGGSQKLYGPGGVRLGNTTNAGLAANTGTPTSGRAKTASRAPGRVVPGAKRVGRGK